MASDDTLSVPRTRDTALQELAASAEDNIPGVDLASITLAMDDQTLQTVAATDPLAEQLDAVQYELREGPCYSAVNDERLILINDVGATSDFPGYGPRAAELGVRSQAATQLVHHGERAGLNLYARRPEAFDGSTVQLAELFATHAGALLSYVEQVDRLAQALHTRTDIGTAVGILMERYDLDRTQAFAFLVRNSHQRNVKLRELAQQVIAGTFWTTGRAQRPDHRCHRDRSGRHAPTDEVGEFWACRARVGVRAPCVQRAVCPLCRPVVPRRSQRPAVRARAA